MQDAFCIRVPGFLLTSECRLLLDTASVNVKVGFGQYYTLIRTSYIAKQFCF